MTMAEKIDQLMLAAGLNRRQLAVKTGVPYTTIDGWFKRSSQNAQLANVRKIADFFDVKLDWLVDDLQDSPPIDPGDVDLALSAELARMDEVKLARVLEYAKFVNSTI